MLRRPLPFCNLNNKRTYNILVSQKETHDWYLGQAISVNIITRNVLYPTKTSKLEILLVYHSSDPPPPFLKGGVKFDNLPRRGENLKN